MAPSNKNSALSSNELFSFGFKANDTASLQSTIGMQSLCAAVFAAHNEREDDRPTFDKYRERDGSAFKEFKAQLIRRYIVARLKKTDHPEMSPEQITRQNAQNSAQMLALGKAMDLADALFSAGVTIESYDEHKHLFMVPVSSLIKPDDSPLGALFQAAKKGSRIPLDGKTYLASDTEGNKIVNFKAYPARVVEMAGYKSLRQLKAETAKQQARNAADAGATGNGSNGTTTNGGASADAIKGDINSWGSEKLLETACVLLNRASDIISEKADGAFKWSDLPEKTRKAIEGILIFRDECLEAEQPKKENGNGKKAAA